MTMVEQAGGDPEVVVPPTPEMELASRVLPTVPEYLARGLDLKKWWDEVEARGGPEDTFPLARSFNQPTRSFGFYGTAPVGGATLPVTGNVQEMFYDQLRVPSSLTQQSAEWMKAQLREFIMKYFMRISSSRPPAAYVDFAQPTPPPALEGLSWCARNSEEHLGFGFTQLFNKPSGSSAIQPFPSYEKYTIVDQRDIGRLFEWILLKVRIFDFSFSFRILGEDGPELVFSENEESYLVVQKELVEFKDEPFQTANGRTVLGEYGIGYSFVKSPTQGPFGFGPGEFDAAIELIKFRIYDTGYISVRMIFVVNRPNRVVNLVVDPVDWSFRLADTFSFGIASKLFAPAKYVFNQLPLRFTVDPVTSYISLANELSNGYAARSLCVSMETLEKVFLLKHFQQHYQTITGTLPIWRQIDDWLETQALPSWVISGFSS